MAIFDGNGAEIRPLEKDRKSPDAYYVEYRKGVRALRGYFGPLWSQKLKVAFHQFRLVGLLEE